MLLTTLLVWTALMAPPSATEPPLFKTMVHDGCKRIRFADDVDTCLRTERREDADLGTVLVVEVFVADAATKRARRLDGFIVPTKYGKATSEIVTVGGRRQAISVHVEGGTGTGYLEMMWLLVDLDETGTSLVARAFEPSSGHLGSLHTQSYATTTKWNVHDGVVRLTHVWQVQLGTAATTTRGGGTVTWIDELVCLDRCGDAEREARLAADEGVFLPRRRLARARVWFASGAFVLRDPRTWQTTSLLVDDVVSAATSP